jgi:hypothetical protein
MTVSITIPSFTANNGDANDVTPVRTAFTVLGNNDTALKTKIDSLLNGRIEDGTTLTLNSLYTGSPVSNLTLDFERGSGTNAAIRWNETTDAFEFNFASTFYNPLFPNLGVNYRSGTLPVWINASTVGVQENYRAIDDTGKRIIAPAGALSVVLSVSGALGLDTGSEANNTWYYLWLCEGTSGVTAIFSASATAPTLPAGYNSFKSRIPCAFRNDGSSNLIPVKHTGRGDWKYLTKNYLFGGGTPETQVYATTLGTTFTPLSLSSFIPPISTCCKLGLFISGAADTLLTRPVGSTVAEGICNVAFGAGFAGYIDQVVTDANQAIEVRSGSSQFFQIMVSDYTITD